MKTAIFGGLLAVALMSPAAHAAEAKQDFQLVNKTGYDIKHVFVSPSKADDWQDDVLGRDTLGDGDGGEVKFNRASTTCAWDLKVTYADDNSSAVWGNIDLCTVEKITIHYNRQSDTTSATFD
jgi:hypothetical protein